MGRLTAAERPHYDRCLTDRNLSLILGGDMGRLNHQRPMLQLMDAKKRGFHLEGISGTAIGKRLFTPGSPSAQPLTGSKEPSERAKIHLVALAIVDHFIATNDCSDANLLLEFVKSEADRDALRKWFLTYGGMRIDSRTGRFKKTKRQPPDRAAGSAHPYWTFKDSPRRKPFHLGVDLSAFVSKAREMKSKKSSNDHIPDSLLRDLEALLLRHGIGFD